jgi:hypothetical protein
LYGSPEETYLTEKADEVVAELEVFIGLCNRTTEHMETVIEMSTTLRASGSAPTVEETVSEFRRLFWNTKRQLDRMDARAKAATKRRVELTKRVDLARLLLDIRPSVVEAILKRVETARNEAQVARQKFGDTAKRYKPALDFVCEIQREVILPRKFTLASACVALFKD